MTEEELKEAKKLPYIDVADADRCQATQSVYSVSEPGKHKWMRSGALPNWMVFCALCGLRSVLTKENP